MGCSSSNDASAVSGKSTKKMTLAFFDVRGGATGMVSRYLANYCNVPYEMKSYIWADPELKALKANHEYAWLNLPHVVDGKTTISESIAVHMYIAAKGRPEMLGKTPQEKANRYRMHCIITDSFWGFWSMVMKQGTTKESLSAKGIELFAKVNDYLGDKKFICGDTPSIADFGLLETTNYLEKTIPGCVA